MSFHCEKNENKQKRGRVFKSWEKTILVTQNFPKKVFEAEKLMTRSKWYHRHCFTCRQCSHQLDQSSVMEGPNSDIYCKTCYVREYFTGGRNKFCDPGESSMDKGRIPGLVVMEGDSCSEGCVFESHHSILDGHFFTIICITNCKNWNKKVFFSVVPASDGSSGDICRKCKGKVFEVDKIMARYNSWLLGSIISWIKCTYIYQSGQRLWLSWQSSRFRHQRSAVWIQSSAKLFSVNCIEKTKKKKRPGIHSKEW